MASLRLRFWLAAADVAHAIDSTTRVVSGAARDRTRRLYLWTIRKASDATDWGKPETMGDALDEETPRVN